MHIIWHRGVIVANGNIVATYSEDGNDYIVRAEPRFERALGFHEQVAVGKKRHCINGKIKEALKEGASHA